MSVPKVIYYTYDIEIVGSSVANSGELVGQRISDRQ